MSRNQQAACIVVLGLLIAVAYAMCLPRRWDARLAENNFEANLIRLQAFLHGPPPRTVLFGSSLTGRLLPEFFQKTPAAPVDNLGLDGCSAVLGLDLALSRPPPLAVIELNSLLRAPDGNNDLLKAAIESPGFRASRYLPFFRADARPSSILYTWLKFHRDRALASSVLEFQTSEPAMQIPLSFGDLPAPRSVAFNGSGVGISSSGDPLQDKAVSQIRALLARGSRVVLLRMPHGTHRSTDIGDQLAAQLNLRLIDLGAELGRRQIQVTYTDDGHLALPSARVASQLLGQLLAN